MVLRWSKSSRVNKKVFKIQKNVNIKKQWDDVKKQNEEIKEKNIIKLYFLNFVFKNHHKHNHKLKEKSRIDMGSVSQSLSTPVT